MPTQMLTEPRQQVSPQPFPVAPRPDSRRVRRLKLNAAAWALGTILVTTLWVVVQWGANGAFETFGHEGDAGQWNPTLWAIVVGGWGLVVGIMALGVHFAGSRSRFHLAAWSLGMLALTPLWALLEWQDNGAFERWRRNSQPGDWDPWILVVAGVWALAAAFLVLQDRRHRRRT